MYFCTSTCVVSLIGMKGHSIKDGWTETDSSDTQLQLGQRAATRTVPGEGCVPFTGLKSSVRSSMHKPQGDLALPPATFHQVFISLVLVGGLTQQKNVSENGCKHTGPWHTWRQLCQSPVHTHSSQKHMLLSLSVRIHHSAYFQEEGRYHRRKGIGKIFFTKFFKN